jgi:hypothetical protein
LLSIHGGVVQKMMTLIGSSGLKRKILIAIDNQLCTLITAGIYDAPLVEALTQPGAYNEKAVLCNFLSIPSRTKLRIGETICPIWIVMRVGYLANLLSGVNLLQRIEDDSGIAGFGVGICFYGELPCCRLYRLSAAEP